MALRFRRGLDIERQAVVFVEGEPTYTTDNKEFFIGDGVTPGGIQIGGLNNLIDDTTPRLGGDLDLNSHKIIGTGNVEINGDLKITGSIDVGVITANYTGSLFADDSTLIVDAINHRVYADLMSVDGNKLFDASSKQFNLAYTSITSLGDVNFGDSAPGAVLSWNGVEFVGGVFGSESGNPVLDGHVLQYDGNIGWMASHTLTLSDSTVLIDFASGEINLGLTDLQSHKDVIHSNLQADDVLTWDGLNWVNKQLTIDNAAISLANLDDVVIADLQVNDSLIWDGVTWTNSDASTIQNLNDVVIADLQVNDSLIWDGVTWTNSDEASTIQNLNDVIISTDTLATSDVLTWDGVTWTNMPSLIDLTTILDLDDVDVDEANLSPSDVLIWNGFTWTNSQPFDQLDGLNDVGINPDSLTELDVLTWTGTFWTNSQISADGLVNLNDVGINATTLAPLDVLTWTGDMWTNSPIVLNALQELDNVIINETTLAPSDVLTWDGTDWINSPIVKPEILLDLDDVVITNPVVGDVLTWDGTDFVNLPVSQATGTFKGNLLATDDTVIVDADNNSLTVNQASMESIDFSGTLDLTANGEQPFQGITLNTSSRFSLQFNKSFATPFDANTNEWLGQIIAYNSSSDGLRLRDAIYLADDGIYFMAGTPSIDQYTYSESQRLAFYSGKLGIGIDEPVEKLHVVGNAKMSGFVQFGSMTTAERDGLTAENGMVIYNSTTNKFQGYANSIWVDLH